MHTSGHAHVNDMGSTVSGSPLEAQNTFDSHFAHECLVVPMLSEPTGDAVGLDIRANNTTPTRLKTSVVQTTPTIDTQLYGSLNRSEFSTPKEGRMSTDTSGSIKIALIWENIFIM